jgi:uncharacterized protein (DUF488 family)
VNERAKGRRPEGRLYTIGHSTRSLEELVDLLRDHDVTQLVDVRHFPRSRRNPQFNVERLESDLPAQGIAYAWMGETLGGLRKGGYEAYMETEGFRRGLDELEALVRQRTTAIMCAEIVWFRCHRRFIARQMVARGYRVGHIVRRGKPVYEESLPGDAEPS